MGNNGIIGININNKDYYYIKQGVLGWCLVCFFAKEV
jgi:hypothetical protein